MVKRDLSLLTDFYQLTMMQGYLRAGVSDRQSVFELFFRANPSGNGFSVFAGIAQFAEYLDSLEFGGDDIDYLRSLGVFDDGFLEYLRGFRFEGSVEAFAEGSVCFPNEPLMVVKAPIAQANFIETALLNIVNHQTLIATKATRVRLAAGDDEVLEFGLRRAQGADAGVLGARAAFIGGVHATSNVLAGLKFGIPVRGTHSHSWVMGFGDELEAFRQYAISFPDKCILLVDTYDTLESGIPNAIKVFDELKAKGKLGSHGIRLDSGDFAYLSKQARKMLDSSGHRAATITASGDLDEDLIQNLKLQGARIDTWGVGTKLITSASAPSLGGVYKLCAIDEGTGVLTPKIKVSENPDKITTPGVKKVYRIYDSKHNKIKADLITLEHEDVSKRQDLTLFDPKAPWKKMKLRSGEFDVRPMLEPVTSPAKTVSQIREYSLREQNTLWDEHKRLVNPHVMPVDLSQELFDLKNKLLFN